MRNLKTIVAPVTALIKQTIAIIRLSGPDTKILINKCLSKQKQIKNFNHKIYFRTLYDQDHTKIDDVLILTFNNPQSLTGEDVVEIQSHGSVYIVEQIIQLLINHGAVMAHKGEFLERAFLNKKINLINSESINQLIKSNSIRAAQILVQNLTPNRKAEELTKIQAKILEIIANIEINIDYPEYDGVGDLTETQLKNKINHVALFFKKVLSKSILFQSLNQEVKIAIIGQPNVGKSSLLNCLIQENKAIVSDFSGTTRDIVEGKIIIDDITLTLLDTAGIRSHTTNVVEKIGITKTLNQIKKAHLIFLVFDSNSSLSQEDLKILKITQNHQRIIVNNKSDLKKRLVFPSQILKSHEAIVDVSALKNNIAPLIKATQTFLHKKFYFQDDDLILSSNYHVKLLKKILFDLTAVKQEINHHLPFDLISIKLKEIWNNLKQITGEDFDVTLLDAIFRDYCLGK